MSEQDKFFCVQNYINKVIIFLKLYISFIRYKNRNTVTLVTQYLIESLIDKSTCLPIVLFIIYYNILYIKRFLKQAYGAKFKSDFLA
jgi:hypothetical protein